MNWIPRTSFLGLVGLGLFLVTLLTSPWMFSYLPSVALLKAFLFSAVLIVLGEGLRVLPRQWELAGLMGFSLLLSAYFFGWFFFLSSFAGYPFLLRGTLSVVTTVFVVFVTLYAVWNAVRFSEGGGHVWVFAWLGAVAGLYVVLSFVPVSYLLTNGAPHHTRQQVLMGEKNPLQRAVYPFSLPVQFGVDRYGWVLPDLPEKQIFFLLLDGLRDDYVGATMAGNRVTPVLDGLADTGIRFDQYRVQSSWTKPSTASLFTGLYPGEHGALYGGGDRGRYAGHVLSERHNTLAERLNQEGYENFGAVMSGHISGHYQYDQGFDVYLSPGQGYRGDFSAMNQALFWMLREQPRKGFVYLHVKGPHQPFNLGYLNKSYWRGTDYYRNGRVVHPGRFAFRSTSIVDPLRDGEVQLTDQEERFLRYLYGAQLNFLDRRFVKPLLERLRTLGVFEEGLIVVTGDHGEELNDHGGYAHGETLYEETIRTPLIVKFPENSPFRRPSGRPQVESIDLMASLTEYARGGLGGVRGDSFLSLLTAEDRADTGRFRESFAQQPAKETIEQASIVRYPWKYIHHYGETYSELYHLGKDPREKNPIRGRSSTVDELRNRLFDVLGSDSVPASPAVTLREATKAELKNLEGLGYLE